MTAIIQAPQINEAVPLGWFCTTCAAIPCINPSFCEACRKVDRRLGYKQPSVEADLKTFARRASDLANQWRAGRFDKADAVDRSHNYALALGLHYRLARNADEFLRDRPTDIIQRVLASAFDLRKIVQ